MVPAIGVPGALIPLFIPNIGLPELLMLLFLAAVVATPAALIIVIWLTLRKREAREGDASNRRLLDENERLKSELERLKRPGA